MEPSWSPPDKDTNKKLLEGVPGIPGKSQSEGKEVQADIPRTHFVNSKEKYVF